MIDDGLVEKDGGLIVKEKVPKKRFIGLVSVHRAARPDELERIARKEEPPDNIEIGEDVRREAERRIAQQGQTSNVYVMEHPKAHAEAAARGRVQPRCSRGLLRA